MKPLQPGLHVAATPIGNLADASPRLKTVLSQASRVLCEDTRVTGKLFAALGIDRPPLTAYHEHNAERVRPAILEELENGAAMALVSDAGTPLISDPGYKLVRAVRDAGVHVFAVPGPSALTAALSIGGAPTDQFTFVGFLPRGAGQKRRKLESLADRQETLVVYESGPRLAATLTSITEVFGPRRVSIARELTKMHEEVIEGDAAELTLRFDEKPPRGEIVLMVHPGDAAAPDLDAVLAELLERESLSSAARQASTITGLPKKACYDRALALQKQEADS